MLPRPAWLGLGVVVAAGTASYEPMAGDSASAVVAAATAALALGMASSAVRTVGRRGLGTSLAVASLGAGVVAARLAIGLVVGGTAPPETTILPPGTGPWLAGVESAHETNGRQIATLALTGTSTRCSAQMPAYPRLVGGDTISWSGDVRPLTDGDYDRFLASQGIVATCRATDLTILSHDDSPAGRLEALRQASGDALQRVLPEPEGGLAAAILVGLRDRVDREVAAAFTTAGVSHIVAISGWNIAIVAAVVAALLRGHLARRSRAIVTIGAIIAYSLFAGGSPSVLRAAVMAGLALAAVESGRGSRVTVGLAWAASIMLVAEPATVADVGFQLSAAATAGLVVWGTPLTAWLAARAPWIPGSVRETLGISLAAQAATLPIVLLAFGRLALIAPAANLIAVPLVPPVMAAGAVAFGAGWLACFGLPGSVAGLLAMPAALLLSALVAVVGMAAAVPGANETLPFPANAVGAAGAVGLMLLLHRTMSGHGSSHRANAIPRPRGAATTRGASKPRGAAGPPIRPRYRWAVAGAALLAVVLGSVVAARPDGGIHVVVLDVGQGDSILLEGDRGGRILVDGGPDPDALIAALDSYVPTWDRRLDAIVLTHPHDDHVAGLVAVVERYQVGRAFESGWSVETPAYRAWKSALSGRGIAPERLATGDVLRIDDATLTVLWPDDGTVRAAGLDPKASDNRKTNDASIVLLGEFEGRRFLLTGDAEDDVDPILTGRGLPAVDMLKVAHHGSATASSDVLLAVAHPAVAVVSVGADNPYGHPNGATMARLRSHSSLVLRTDGSGTVDTRLDRTAVTVVSSGPPPMAGLPRVFAPAPRGPGEPPQPGSPPPQPGPAVPRLLYDSADVRTEPPRQRGAAHVARTPGLAPPPFTGRRRDGGLAGLAGGFGWSIARPPPGGGGLVAA